MKRKMFLKTCAILSAGALMGSLIPVYASENEITEEVAAETVEEESVEIPMVETLSGEKTETADGTIERFSREVVVEEESKGEVEFFVYTPSDIHPVGATTPILLVYGDQAFTAETVEESLTSSGLDTIAREQNCSVVFVNPMEETWGSVDADAYLYTLIDLWSEDTGSETGKTADESKYIGTTQRVYVIAEGAGADFAAQNLISDAMQKFNIFATFYYLPTSVLLINPTVDETAECTFGMPTVVAGGSETLAENLKAISKKDEYAIVLDAAEGLDADTIQTSWDQLFSKVRRQLSGYTSTESYELLPVYDFEEYGIQVSIEKEEINGKDLEWYEYIPEGLDMTGDEPIPLVFTFHGGGNHAEYQAIASEWPLIGKEEGFMVVAVNQHVDNDGASVVALLEVLEEKYPAIDKSRIYASGFSMGSLKSWELGMCYPELFAGIAPMDAVTDPSQWETREDLILPTYYVGGEEDGLLVFPHQQAFGGEGGEGNGDYTIQKLFAMNQIEYPGFDETLDPIWGMEFTSTVEVPTGNGLHVATENYIESADGNVYTALVSMSNQAHAVLAGNSRNAWNFLKQFSRNEDGSITINQD